MLSQARNSLLTSPVDSFLGLFESCITPAFTLITSQWYLKSEQGTRTGPSRYCSCTPSLRERC